MHIVTRFFQFYIDASVHVAFAVVALYLITIKDLNSFANWYLVGFLFSATIVCYNFIKYGVEAGKYLIVSKPAHKSIQIFSFIASLFSVFFFFVISPILWCYVIVFTLISALYAIPFLPHSKNLRSLGGLKIFLVAFIWMGFSFILPVIENGTPTASATFLMGLKRFLLVLILILPFEIRDLKYDDEKLRTVPQRLGIAQTKRVGYHLILVYYLLGLLVKPIALRDVIFSSIVCLVLVFAIYNTTENRSDYYTSFWVESIPMIMLVFSYVLEMIFV